MFCRNCGKEVVQTAAICPGCGAQPLAGKSFCQACGAQTATLAELCLKCGTRLSVAPIATVDNISPKSRLVTVLLAFFLGEFGAHRFYVGKTGTAITQLVLGLIGIATWFIVVGIFIFSAVAIWAFVDFVMACAGAFKDKESKVIKNWQA